LIDKSFTDRLCGSQGEATRILDVTAGLGSDLWLLAAVSSLAPSAIVQSPAMRWPVVTGIERNRVLYSLISHELARAKQVCFPLYELPFSRQFRRFLLSL
jgi:hypothetical protein